MTPAARPLSGCGVRPPRTIVFHIVMAIAADRRSKTYDAGSDAHVADHAERHRGDREPNPTWCWHDDH